MKIRGPLFGGATGFIITGNPYGALLGAVAGIVFEKEILPTIKLSPAKKEYLNLMATIFAGYNKAVRPDLKTWNTVLQSYQSYFKLGDLETRFVMDQMKSEFEKMDAKRLNSSLKTLSELQLSSKEKERILGILYFFIAIQKTQHAEMQQFLEKISAWFFVTDEQMEKLKKKWSPNAIEIYRAFDATPLDKLDSIKKKYTRLIKSYHPDVKRNGQEESPDDRKAKIINQYWAY
jgi:DnaJ-domain-containing protein 1